MSHLIEQFEYSSALFIEQGDFVVLRPKSPEGVTVNIFRKGIVALAIPVDCEDVRHRNYFGTTILVPLSEVADASEMSGKKWLSDFQRPWEIRRADHGWVVQPSEVFAGLPDVFRKPDANAELIQSGSIVAMVEESDGIVTLWNGEQLVQANWSKSLARRISELHILSSGSVVFRAGKRAFWASRELELLGEIERPQDRQYTSIWWSIYPCGGCVIIDFGADSNGTWNNAHLVGFSAVEPREVWRRVFPRMLMGIGQDEKLIYALSGGRLHAINASNGEIVWRRQTDSRVPEDKDNYDEWPGYIAVLGDNVVVANGYESRIQLYRRKDGVLVGQLRLPEIETFGVKFRYRPRGLIHAPKNADQLFVHLDPNQDFLAGGATLVIDADEDLSCIEMAERPVVELTETRKGDANEYSIRIDESVKGLALEQWGEIYLRELAGIRGSHSFDNDKTRDRRFNGRITLQVSHAQATNGAIKALKKMAKYVESTLYIEAGDGTGRPVKIIVKAA